MKPFIYTISVLLVLGCSSRQGWMCEGNCIDGVGVKKWDHGGIDSGTWVSGKLNGLGYQLQGKPNFIGDTYRGEFQEDDYNGFGVYIDVDLGTRYEGEWRNGKPHGKGKLEFGSTSNFPGRYYDGEWVNDMKHGFGTFFSGEAGDHPHNKYVGQWANNRQDGEGVYYWIDENQKYEGPYKSGKPHGRGKFTFADGTVFEGTWNEGVCDELAEILRHK